MKAAHLPRPGVVAGLAIQVLLLLASLLGALRAPVSARAENAPDGIVSAILQRYLPSADTLAPGLSAGPPSERSNAELAAQFQNPLDLPQFLPRQRLGGLLQRISGSIPPGPQEIDLELDLFAAAAGAQADVRVPLFTQLVTATPLAPPLLGERASAFLLVYQTEDDVINRSYRLAFSVDRLEVVLTAETPAGSSAQQALTAFATKLAQQAAAAPPPVVSDAELLLLAGQAAPEAILRSALDVLLQRYATRPALDGLLRSAYGGAAAAAQSAGIKNLPPLPVLAEDPPQAWAEFDIAWQALEAATSAAIDPRTLAYAAATAAYSGLDCSETFLPPSLVTQDFQAIEGGAGTGLGAVFSADAPYIVLDVVPGSNAAVAGVQIGDWLLAVDGKDLAGIDRRLLTLLLEGGPGTPVTLTLAAPGAESREATLLRGALQTAVPAARPLSGGAAYLRLDSLADGARAADGLRQALTNPDVAGATGLVLDLRSSEGGDPAAAADVAALFVPPGSLVATRSERNGSATQLDIFGTPLPVQPPLVVLVDPAGTGPAAELLAAALQDLGRAMVVGTPTAGCADPMTLVTFLDGSGASLVSGHPLAGPDRIPLAVSGVTPDILVERSSADWSAGRDPQLDAAAAALPTST